MAFGWTLYNGDGKTPAPGQAVAPNERLTWGRTVGIGAQHVIAMFGATFVFPLVMGLDANLAILMSGRGHDHLPARRPGKVPSYLGTSASFVGAVAAIRAGGGDSGAVTGAILVSGAVLALVGLLVHIVGAGVIHRVLPPAVTGAVVMLIGFNLAPVVAGVYWPQDQWVAFVTMVFVIVASLLLRGFWSRIAVFLALVFGYALSFVLDKTAGQITSFSAADGKVTTHFRTNFEAVGQAGWFGLPSVHAPSFSGGFILLALPAVIALIAENAGHVKAVAEMTRTDLDPYLGRAIGADGLATMVSSAVGGSPTTTYAENIGVMAATRVYSTAAYYVAAVVALILGFCPKFGAIISGTPGGVLGGITVVLYGMIGLLGAKIWKESRVDFANPVNLVPLAAGIILAIGNVSLTFSDTFSLSGIALGTIVAVLGWHVAHAVAPREMRDALAHENGTGAEGDDGGYGQGTGLVLGRTGARRGDGPPAPARKPARKAPGKATRKPHRR